MPGADEPAKPPGGAGADPRAPLLADSRTAQAERVARFLAATPEGATLRAIDAACDVGSPSKLISVMRRDMGYRIESRRITEACSGGARKRPRLKFFLLSGPRPWQSDLFTS
jgi:hypothetical protein